MNSEKETFDLPFNNNPELAQANLVALTQGKKITGYIVESQIDKGEAVVVYCLKVQTQDDEYEDKIFSAVVHHTSFAPRTYRYLIPPMTQCAFYVQNFIACDLTFDENTNSIITKVKAFCTVPQTGKVIAWDSETHTGRILFVYGNTNYVVFFHGNQFSNKDVTPEINSAVSFKITRNKRKKDKYMAIKVSLIPV